MLKKSDVEVCESIISIAPQIKEVSIGSPNQTIIPRRGGYRQWH